MNRYRLVEINTRWPTRESVEESLNEVCAEGERIVHVDYDAHLVLVESTEPA